MRDVPASITQAWNTGEFAAPAARITVQQGKMGLYKRAKNLYASYLLNNPNKPVEVPGVRRVEWSRDTTSDTATCTIELTNADPVPLTQTLTSADWMRMGALTPDYGDGTLAAMHGTARTEFYRLLLPDNIIRTYEGYGIDNAVIPELDPNLVQTGVWIIDDARFMPNGSIIIEARDPGRLPMDHISHPPVVPKNHYPLRYASVPRRSGFKPAAIRTEKVENWGGPTAAPTGLTATPQAGKVALSWDALPAVAPEKSLPAKYQGGDYFYTSDTKRYYLRLNSKWYEADTTSSRAGCKYLYGAATTITQSSVGAQHGSVDYLFGGPGVIHQYTPRYEAIGFRVYVDDNVQDFNLNETKLSVTVPRLTNGVPYQLQVAGIYQELDTGRVEVTNRATETSTPRQIDEPAITGLRADIRADNSTGYGWVSFKVGPGTGTATVTCVIYRDTEEQRFTTDVVLTGAQQWAEIDTKQRSRNGLDSLLPGWNIFVVASLGAQYAPGQVLYRSDGGEVEFFGSPGKVGDPPDPPDAVGYASATDAQGRTVPLEPAAIKVSYHNSSNYPYVGTNGYVYGHHGTHAFDRKTGSYWLSIGNGRPDYGFAYEWIEAKIAKQAVHQIRVRTPYPNMYMWISVMVNGRWVRHKTGNVIPYDADHPLARNQGNIPYVYGGRMSSKDVTITLPQVYPGVERIRYSFSNLYDSNMGVNQYRAAVSEVYAFGPKIQNSDLGSINTPDAKKVSDGSGTEFLPPRIVGGAGDKPGTYEDYSDLVKLALAWSGCFWPDDGYEKLSDGTKTVYDFGPAPHNLGPKVDPVLGAVGGRVWGNIENTGTSGVADLPVSMFDKKPLMDMVVQVRDIIGFLFWFDELGRAQFRRPNVFSKGNDVISLTSTRRVNRMVLLDSNLHVTDLGVNLSSRSMREKVFISSSDGKYKASANGFRPNNTGLRRVGGWTDQGFKTETECRLMAGLIAVRQLFTWRTNTLTIPGYPRIQVNDQVRIIDRITNERHVHYVSAITSELVVGQSWNYTLSTHWLGEDPAGLWAFAAGDLEVPVQTLTGGN